jgi:hypothetical protein
MIVKGHIRPPACDRRAVALKEIPRFGDLFNAAAVVL